ncbi:indolepyruvate ferredoxin oxidoreductase family protein [uncultured Alsobacter sp.]|uniref:indolepyruvate ferredoxin oxidoreductase family protein n=1 Tax=uncultured Alsobacter sp. TaxID=1748258 RepID=UPI0025E712AB|nr:indolepyruvate ferredoxin oxidoreductase family protein [uncultured Alsobacter sp.]
MSDAPALARTLEERFTLERGRVLLTGNEAIVRLALAQRARDVAAGLNTAGFVSGYRGSPLARVDREFQKVGPLLDRNHIVFRAGLNEDLAATAVWGSQQLGLFPGARYDGVFALWYGKGPGVDRSMDVIRHAQACGTAEHGGTLLLLGDDHGAVSSTLPHQSDHNMISAMVPILSPAGLGEFIDMGLMGFAMSRFSGSWIGFKCQTDIVESTGSVDVDPLRPAIVLPVVEKPAGGLGIRWPDGGQAMERRLLGAKLDAVKAFARANALNPVSGAGTGARLGIVASGKAWLDLKGALALLGLTEQGAAALGIRFLKLGLVWPLDAQEIGAFADGLQTVLVVEEKRGVIEGELKQILYNAPEGRRPRVIGKEDLEGRPLLPAWGEINPAMVARALATLLPTGFVSGERLDQLAPKTTAAAAEIQREPYFCAGCPHSVSTRLPEGSRASTGIGCHMMIVGLPERATATFTQMGGEGVAWTGMAPFTDERHIFVNMGDGTYFHSGLLAIRAAVSSGVNATYKILFNDAVAMTGGQRIDGTLTVPDIVRQLEAEGVKRVEVVADDPDRWLGALPGVTVSHRDELDAVQRRLREFDGVTALVYDQVCAAEKRRRRKHGSLAQPAARAFINEAVCEGCGDCSAVSNCIAVEPLDTALGLKRRVNQSVCNTDLSCTKGFCPSFVTVEGVVPRRKQPGQSALTPAVADGLPEPVLARPDRPLAILLAGIGGTGVLTVSAVLAQAAHLDGLAAQSLDQTGVAQKNGAVLSHLRVARNPGELAAARIAQGEADLVLGFDLMTAAGTTAIASLAPGRTAVVVDPHVTPPAAFVKNNAVDLRSGSLQRVIARAAGAEPVTLDAGALATRLLGDAIGANMMLLGFAWQKGLVPISRAAIDEAIATNGVAIAMNRTAFALGRLAAHDPASPVFGSARPDEPPAEDLAARIRRHVSFLTAYQDDAYAARFAAAVEAARLAEGQRAPGLTGFASAVCEATFKAMAIKDEYEVARLYADPAFARRLAETFEGTPKLTFHLAPPLLAQRLDPRTGRPAKIAFGPWMARAFKALAAVRRWRGTWLDPFARIDERKHERRWRDEHLALVERLSRELTPENHALAVELASLPLDVKGFGPVKEANAARVAERRETLLALWDGKPAATQARAPAPAVA